MGSAHRRVAHASELSCELSGLSLEVFQGLVFDLVLALHLLHDELRVGDDLELVHAAPQGALEPGDQAAVLGDVVRRGADR